MFEVGTRVRAIPSKLHYFIAEMLEDKVGTVTDIEDDMRDAVVHFPGTRRRSGLFAMDYSQIELA